MVCVTAVSGCTPTTMLYDWSHYDQAQLASYVAHDEAAARVALEETITSARQAGHRIPPGACAEFGFLLYKQGQRERAVEYFEQEAQLFPESKPLMTRLISKMRQQATDKDQAPTEEAGKR